MDTILGAALSVSSLQWAETMLLWDFTGASPLAGPQVMNAGFTSGFTIPGSLSAVSGKGVTQTTLGASSGIVFPVTPPCLGNARLYAFDMLSTAGSVDANSQMQFRFNYLDSSNFWYFNCPGYHWTSYGSYEGQLYQFSAGVHTERLGLGGYGWANRYRWMLIDFGDRIAVRAGRNDGTDANDTVSGNSYHVASRPYKLDVNGARTAMYWGGPNNAPSDFILQSLMIKDLYL